MKWNRYVRIVVVIGIIAVMCGAVSAGMGVIAETHVTSGETAPACTAPCECISDTTAIARWGVDGYEKCSKTICGQDAKANVQYYCFHQVGSPVPVVTNVPVQAPVPSAAIPAAPAAAGVTQKSPAGIVPIIAAVGAALLAAAGMRRK